jgi:uncharacterized protein (TIGR03435 family)
MKKTGKVALIIFAFAFAVVPLLSQTAAKQKPSFEVVSIKPSAPSLGIRGGGPRGDRYSMVGATLRTLLQNGFSRANNTPLGGQLQVINAPNWIDSDRYDIDAKADCSGGILPREQMQLMVQSMLEDRFQLKSHMETRELPIYNLVIGKDGPKIKKSEDQTPSPFAAAGPPQPCGPAPAAPPPPLPPPPAPGQPFDFSRLPRGAMVMMMNPTTGMTMQASGVPLTNLVGMLQQQAGRPIIDKTDLKGLFDFKLNFLPENQPNFGPGPPGGLGPGPGPATIGPAPAPTTAAADPIPSVFTAIQEQLGLRLESAKGPVEVLVIESVQKPTEN